MLLACFLQINVCHYFWNMPIHTISQCRYCVTCSSCLCGHVSHCILCFWLTLTAQWQFQSPGFALSLIQTQHVWSLLWVVATFSQMQRRYLNSTFSMHSVFLTIHTYSLNFFKRSTLQMFDSFKVTRPRALSAVCHPVPQPFSNRESPITCPRVNAENES